MSSDNDKKAAEEWEENQSDYWYDNTPQNESYWQAFLAGCAHKEKDFQGLKDSAATWRKRFDKIHEIVSPGTESTVTEVINKVSQLHQRIKDLEGKIEESQRNEETYLKDLSILESVRKEQVKEIQDLESEREQIAREYWDAAREIKATGEFFEDMDVVHNKYESFNDYWQQKQKERIG